MSPTRSVIPLSALTPLLRISSYNGIRMGVHGIASKVPLLAPLPKSIWLSAEGPGQKDPLSLEFEGLLLAIRRHSCLILGLADDGAFRLLRAKRSRAPDLDS